MCDLVCEGQCGPGTECKTQLDICCDQVIGEASAHEVDDQLLDSIVDDKLSKMSKSKKYKVKKVLRSVGFDGEEQEHFNLITQCINWGVPLEFVVDDKKVGCEGALDGKNSTSTLEMAIARGCAVHWVSLYNRAIFYKTCLEHFDMEQFYRSVRHHTGLLDQIKRNIKRYSEDFSDAEIAGGAQMIGGGLLMGLGVVIPPLAPFTSVIGTVLTLRGTGTSLTSTLLGASWMVSEAQQTQLEMKEIECEYNEIAQMIALFLKSVKAVKDVGDKTRTVQHLQQAITTAYINAAPGAIASAKIIGIAANKVYSKLAPKISLKLAKTSLKAFTVTSSQSDMIVKLSKSIGTKLSPIKDFFGKILAAKIGGASVRGSISTAGKMIVPGISLASGIYSIIIGSDTSNVHNGLLHQVQLARRELEYNTDEVIKAYQELGLEQSGNTSWKAKTSVSLIDHHKLSGYGGMKLELESVDEDGNNQRCVTDLLGLDHSGEGWSKMADVKQLGGCRKFFIFNHTASIRIIEGTAQVDGFQIGTNGNFLPSLSCDGNITASDGSKSEWLACGKKVGMRKFKTHTSNKDYAGTSNSLYFGFIIERNDGTIVTCKTGNQISTQSKYRGTSDTYTPVSDSFGSCDDDELATALHDRNVKREGDNIKVTVESKKYGAWNDGWHFDLLKAYFLTEQDKMMVITCEICNARTNETEPGKGDPCGNGWGTWITGNETTFNCHVLDPKSPERSLQSFRVKVCDQKDAGSDSDQLRLQICNNGTQHLWNEIVQKGHTDRLNGALGCCTTNLFGKDFSRNEWSQRFDGSTARDDGGEILGQCEGFPIDATAVNLRLFNEHSNAVCVSEYEFFGGSKTGVTSVSHFPFISCQGRQVREESSFTASEANSGKVCEHWSDLGKGYCEGWVDWHDWLRVNSYCSYVNQTSTIKRIALMVCDEEDTGSTADIQAVIQNMDGERCTTDVFNTGGLKKGDYFEVTDIGEECRGLEIREGQAEVKIGSLCCIVTNILNRNCPGLDCE